MPKYSKRLKEIIKLVAPYRRIADVGCDHGYLALEGFNNDLIDYALLIDNKEGPLNSAKNNLKNIDNSKYDLSLSSGISSLRCDIECVLILGMGGINIVDILKQKNKLENINKIILQPNNNSYLVRKYLMENGFKITDELIIYDKKYYEIIVSEVGIAQYNELQLKYGPINLIKKDIVFNNFLINKITRLKKVKDIDKVDKEIKEMESLL